MQRITLKKSIAFTGLSLFIFPMTFILWQEISSPLGQSNPFMIVYMLMYGGIPTLIGLLIFILVHPRSKTKLTTPLLAVTSYLLLLPAMWASIRQKRVCSYADMRMPSKILPQPFFRIKWKQLRPMNSFCRKIFMSL